MERVTSEAALRKAALTMGRDSIEAGVRGRIREWIEELVEAELTAVLTQDSTETQATGKLRGNTETQATGETQGKH